MTRAFVIFFVLIIFGWWYFMIWNDKKPQPTTNTNIELSLTWDDTTSNDNENENGGWAGFIVLIICMLIMYPFLKNREWNTAVKDRNEEIQRYKRWEISEAELERVKRWLFKDTRR